MTSNLLAVSFILFVLATSCSGTLEKNKEDEVKAYPVYKIAEKDTLLSVPYVADIHAHRNIELRTRAGGILERIFIKEGQHVTKGQPLFKISDSELQIELKKAEAAYNSARADARVAEVEVDRVKKLVGKEVVSHTELDLANAKYKALLAKADMALAEQIAVEERISYTRIAAPFTGIVDRIPLKEGSLLTAGSFLTSISDVGTVYAYFNVSENEYLQVAREGSLTPGRGAISLVLPDGSVYPATGELAAAESEIDANTGNIAYKAIFNNPEKILRHGASGKILITRTIPNAILVPQKAVFEIQDKNYVFMVDGDGIARMKSIDIMQRIADCYVVDNGLKTGDKVIVEGIQSLKDGQKVKENLL